MSFDVSVIKYAQDLHTEKRNIPEATNVNPNLALKITSVSKSCLIDMFEAGGILSKEDLCNQIRKQWMIYQNEHNLQIVYVKEQKVKKAVVQESPRDSTLE